MNRYITYILAVLFVVVPGVSQAQVQDTCIDLQFNLQKGSIDSATNGEVSILQDFLQSSGYLRKLNKDESAGYFGNDTRKAVKKFQKANGIKKSGIVNSATRAKIKEISCVAPPPPPPPGP